MPTCVSFWEKSFKENYANPVFIQYEMSYIYGFPENEVSELFKVCRHGGPVCDPDHQTDVADDESIDTVASFIRSRMNGVSDVPAKTVILSLINVQEMIIVRLQLGLVVMALK